tara:strand:+ start:532 stop:1440 length:909 start_codon:yes stop_codon:yes gene_type:complete
MLKISFVEVQNFRKLKSAHIGFDDQTTLFVGANNSGKTSAMLALRYFLTPATALGPKLTFRDITIENWGNIDGIGLAWEGGDDASQDLVLELPALDVWLEVPLREIHHVVHILPTIDWSGGLLGVRLQLQPKNTMQLRSDYLAARKRANAVELAVSEGSGGNKLSQWPVSLSDFLSKRLNGECEIEAYPLDPLAHVSPTHGVATPQKISDDVPPLPKNAFRSLIRIDRIDAQREFSDAGIGGVQRTDADGNDVGGRAYKRKLSVQLREYYDRHVSPNNDDKVLDEDDIKALVSIQGVKPKSW